MSDIRWYKRDPKSALRGMAGLTLEERGAYNTVLDLIYDTANNLDDDDRITAGLLGCDLRVWRRIKTRLMACGKLYSRDGKLRNRRADTGVDECLARIGAAREAGIASANSKAAKSHHKPNGTADIFSTTAHTTVDQNGQPPFQQPKREERKKESSSFNAMGEKEPEEHFVSHERMVADLARLGINPNRKPSATNGIFAPNNTTLPKDQRLAIFQASIAKVVTGGWITVKAATDPSDHNHKLALKACQQAAITLDKGWPNDWPTAPVDEIEH